MCGVRGLAPSQWRAYVCLYMHQYMSNIDNYDYRAVWILSTTSWYITSDTCPLNYKWTTPWPGQRLSIVIALFPLGRLSCQFSIIAIHRSNVGKSYAGTVMPHELSGNFPFFSSLSKVWSMTFYDTRFNVVNSP